VHRHFIELIIEKQTEKKLPKITKNTMSITTVHRASEEY
jgi:hypothetical protein